MRRSVLWLIAGVSVLVLTLAGTGRGRALIREGVEAMYRRKSGPRWDGLTERMRAAVPVIENYCAARGVNVMFWDGWRSPADEEKAIAAGTSKLSDPLNTMHAWGAAADFVPVDDLGRPSWPDASDPRWQTIADAIEAAGLLSGGRAWGWDWPHAQLRDVSMSELRANYGDRYQQFIAENGGNVSEAMA